MHRAVLLAAMMAAVFLVTANVARAEPKTWQLASGGDWPQVEVPTSQAADAPNPTLDRVELLLQDSQNRSAEKAAVQWVVSHKQHPQRARGLFLIARALYQYGNRVRAFYYLDELLDDYPDSPYYYPALEMQYQIADAYLKGYKRRFLRIPMFHAEDEGIEMLYRIQQRSPGSPLAERALLRTANYYYNDQQYDFAADTYGAYLRTYPRSPASARVKLRQAYSMYAQFRGLRFDATPMIDAREQLREVVAQHEDLAAQENIPTLLEQIDRNLARKLYVTAGFYRRTHQPRGAAYTYRYIEKAYPTTPEAQKASVALKALPAGSLNDVPEPAITPDYGPGSPQEEPVRATVGARKRDVR
jgi:outer membrane protein assembly factor BamD (BamD/ComL family)